ncbi:hypothetical protein BH09BAC6_BH09BAC6_10970 [soil metagenome]|jgi:hypothetical protein
MVEVFKTNVQKANQAKKIITQLLQHFPDCRINFDLDDCDKILRVEGEDFINGTIMSLVNSHGFTCEVLC